MHQLHMYDDASMARCGKADRDKNTYTYTYDTHLPPFTGSRKPKDVEITVGAETSLINAVLLRMHVSRVLTVSRTLPSRCVKVLKL